jgi:membrane fusion protein (multidrug efflux system)
MPDDATIVALRSDTAATPTAKREAPQEQPDRPGAMPSALEKPARSPRRPWRRWALFALLPLAVIVGCYWYITGGAVMSTDDSYVEADKVGISTDISGIVADVDVTENQHVAADSLSS